MNTVISDQHPQVCFLHCEKLRALTNCKKRFIFGVLFSCKFIFGSFQADLFGRWGVDSHPSHPPAYAPVVSTDFFVPTILILSLNKDNLSRDLLPPGNVKNIYVIVSRFNMA